MADSLKVRLLALDVVEVVERFEVCVFLEEDVSPDHVWQPFLALIARELL